MCKRLTLEQFGFVSALFYLHQFAPFRFAGHYAVAPRPHASRPTRHQRDQVVRRLSPAGYCLTPTTDLSKTERDPIATSGPTIPVWHQTGRSLRKKQSVCPGSPPLDRSLTAGGAQRQSLQACLPMAISRNSCSLLDFPEFAQAVSYGVPGTHVILREDGLEWARFSRPRRRSNLMSTDGEPRSRHLPRPASTGTVGKHLPGRRPVHRWHRSTAHHPISQAEAGRCRCLTATPTSCAT